MAHPHHVTKHSIEFVVSLHFKYVADIEIFMERLQTLYLLDLLSVSECTEYLKQFCDMKGIKNVPTF